MSTGNLGDGGSLPIRLIGGPLDGQTYGDLPIAAGLNGPADLSIPLGPPGPGTDYARSASGQYDPETEMLLFDYVGIVPYQHTTVDQTEHDEEPAADAAGNLNGEIVNESGWEPASRFVIEQSWWIASELCRRHANLRIYETHPGDGMYDVLRVFDPQYLPRSNESVVDMNRAGRIHLHNIPDYEPIQWGQVLAAHSAHEIVRTLERLRGWELTTAGPSATTPASLTYRVVSAMLTRKLNDRDRWDARSAFLDTSSQSGGGVMDKTLHAFPMIPVLARELADTTPSPLPPESRLWVLERAAKPLFLLDDRGFAYPIGGQRIELMPTYKATKSIDAVVDLLNLK